MDPFAESSVRPESSEAGRHLQPDLDTGRVSQAVTESFADVVGLHVERLEVCKRGLVIGHVPVGVGAATQLREVRQMHVPCELLLLRRAELDERELAGCLVEAVARLAGRAFDIDE